MSYQNTFEVALGGRSSKPRCQTSSTRSTLVLLRSESTEEVYDPLTAYRLLKKMSNDETRFLQAWDQLMTQITSQKDLRKNFNRLTALLAYQGAPSKQLSNKPDENMGDRCT